MAPFQRFGRRGAGCAIDAIAVSGFASRLPIGLSGGSAIFDLPPSPLTYSPRLISAHPAHTHAFASAKRMLFHHHCQRALHVHVTDVLGLQQVFTVTSLPAPAWSSVRREILRAGFADRWFDVVAVFDGFGRVGRCAAAADLTPSPACPAPIHACATDVPVAAMKNFVAASMNRVPSGYRLSWRKMAALRSRLRFLRMVCISLPQGPP